MRKFSLLGAFVALLLSVSSIVGALQARPAALSRIILDVPVKPSAKLGRAIDNVLVILKDRRFFYLDLSIQFRRDGPAPFVVTKEGQPLERQAEGCRLGPFALGDGRIYHLAPINNNHQLLLSVVTGKVARFPYLDVSCEYKNPAVGALRVRGFFHIVCNRGVDALNLQLRPFNPSSAQARQVLSAPVRRVAGQIAKLAARRPAGAAPARPSPQTRQGGKPPVANNQRRQRTPNNNRSASAKRLAMKCL